ncbi:MAG TPA: CHAP domain-containing protein [Verrucomicrobiae bacterium]|nr:CHAP domain-containing protein [Verrucomicrobiae bacterium]
MIKQKIKNTGTHLRISSSTISHRHRLIAAVCMLVFGASFLLTPLVTADRFDEQIRSLSQDSATRVQSRAQLGAEAATLQDVINRMQGEINSLQAQINENQRKSDELQKQIVTAEAELAKQKNLLGENIKAMYLEGDITTLEMLASSKDLSEFVDKEQYRNSVKDKIKDTLDKVNALKLQLKSQRETLEQMIGDQKVMQSKVAAQQAEQNRLLGLNQGQQAELNAQIKNNNAQVAELRKQQGVENARLFGGRVPTGIPGGGGYPGGWAFAPIDSIVDSWGMYNRECVSYTAWKVWSTGRYMPYWGGIGNANQWDENARNAGIPADSSARAGDVAISNRGTYGHAMYVEHVYGDGTIYVSQYNAGLDGYYSEARISANGLVFIHF